jgi:addiction module HigA family antidote
LHAETECAVNPSFVRVTDAAKGLGVTRQALSDLAGGTAGVSVEMAIRLSKAFGSSPETWLGLQMAHDLWCARARFDEIEVRRFEAA